MADRYTYLTQIGLSVAVAWGAAQLVAAGFLRRWACGAASVLVLAVLADVPGVKPRFGAIARRCGPTLWLASRQPVAHHNFGCDLAEQGQPDAAMLQLPRGTAS